MKFLHYNNSTDWEYNVRQNVSSGWFKINKALGTALNIAVPSILLFVCNVSLPTFMLAFIGFDALMVGMDYASIGTYKGSHRLVWMRKKSAYEKELDGLSLEEIKQMRENLRAHGDFYKEKLQILDDRIEEYKCLNTAIPDRHRNTIKFVEEMIEKMRAYSDDDIPFDGCKECIKWIQEKVAKIVAKSDKLLEAVKNNPDTIMIVVNTYDIYAEELLNIILKYQDANEEQQELMEPQLDNLLDSFYNKLDRLFEKVYESQKMSLKLDIDYLTQRLNEDIKENEESAEVEVYAVAESAESESDTEEPGKYMNGVYMATEEEFPEE